jgi:hypothetical protein
MQRVLSPSATIGPPGDFTGEPFTLAEKHLPLQKAECPIAIEMAYRLIN